jgi:hypothetical protein
MGSFIEINDTLQITQEQGFPSSILDLNKHLQHPILLSEVEGLIFSFHKKERARLFHLDPVRVFLVQNINNKWLFWGKALIVSQIITKKLEIDGSWKEGNWETSGSYKIIEIYEPVYQELFTRRESISGKSYF